MRNMSSSISDWPTLFTQTQDNLARKGWIDIANLDPWLDSNNNTLPVESPLAQWRKLLFEAAERVGRDFRAARLVRERLVDAGFVNVTEEVFKVRKSCPTSATAVYD